MSQQRNTRRGKKASSHAKLSLAAALLALLIVPAGAFAQTAKPPERGIGPMTMKTQSGEYIVRLLRREGDNVWLLQQTRDGQFIEAGVNKAQIVSFDFPRGRMQSMADNASTPEQFEQAGASLKKLFASLKQFRDLPGMIADEVLLLQGKLLEKQKRFDEALPLYKDILKQPYSSSQSVEAGLRAGLCLARLERHDEALEYLEADVSLDDEALLSEFHFARGKAFAAMGRHQEALMSYLYLVVFHPYYEGNEERCLAAALPCYVELKDWEGAFKTLAALKAVYPDSAFTQEAVDFLAPYEEELTNERLFNDGSLEDESDESESGVQDE